MSNAGTGQPIVVVVVIVENDGQVLMVKKPDPPDFDPATMYPGSWGFPGGKVDFGESLTDAACRELWEEVGIAIRPPDLEFEAVTEVVSPRSHMVGILYRVGINRISRISCVNREPAKHEQIAWADWGDLPRPLMTGVQQWIAMKLANSKAKVQS